MFRRRHPDQTIQTSSKAFQVLLKIRESNTTKNQYAKQEAPDWKLKNQPKQSVEKPKREPLQTTEKRSSTERFSRPLTPQLFKETSKAAQDFCQVPKDLGGLSEQRISRSESKSTTSQRPYTEASESSTQKIYEIGRQRKNQLSNVRYDLSYDYSKQEEPTVVNYEIQSSGSVSRSSIMQFCKQKGYSLVRLIEQQDAITHDNLGKASITLRVNKFLNEDDRAVRNFFNNAGSSVEREDTQRFHTKSFSFQSKKDLTISTHQVLAPQINGGVKETFLNLSQSKEQQTQPYFGKKSYLLDQRCNQTNRSFENQLRKSTGKTFR